MAASWVALKLYTLCFYTLRKPEGIVTDIKDFTSLFYNYFDK